MRRHLIVPIAALTLASGGAVFVPTATADPVPAPTANECGEPLRVVPDSGPGAPHVGPPGMPHVPDININVPYPKIVPVPEPGPKPDNTRFPSPPPPTNPCEDPCPDITNPVPGGGSGPLGSLGSTGTGSAGSSFSDSGSASSTGSASSALPFPKLTIQTSPVTIPVPYSGGDNFPTTPRPPQAHPPVQADAPAPAPAVPHVSDLSQVSKVTGPGSISRTDKRFQVNATDLGIMWQAAPNKVAVVFGDTFGKGWHPEGANGTDWRSNTLGFSSTSEKDLSKGMAIDSMVQDKRCHAAQVLASRHVDNYEITTIPTSGFALGNRQYMSYMSVKSWGVPGTWTTNYGGIAYSDDGGSVWTKDPWAKWDNIFGMSQFQVSSMVPAGGYVYMFGTPNGRLGTVALARVPQDQLLNKTAYQYWKSGTWTPVTNGFDGTPLFSGPVGELSMRYDADSKMWQASYLDVATNSIVLREAKSPQGAWSGPATLVSGQQYPSLYGGFLHPWSTGKDLYFTISQWNEYNVYLMHVKLG